jgi:hypothetical protein
MKTKYQVQCILQLIPKKTFNDLVKKWNADKGTKNFKSFEMTCIMIVSSILGLGSFRDVEETFAIPKSTFGDALSKRPSGFFQDLTVEILKAMKANIKDKKIKRGLREVLALDSSEILVHGSAYDLNGWKQKQVGDQHKASGKLHTIWNVDKEWIEDFRITPGRKADSPVSLYFKPLPDKMYVFDRAYNDLEFWHKITEHSSHFVTRLKDSARIHMIEIKLKLKKKILAGVLHDGIYSPTKSALSRHKMIPINIKFRHIIYSDPVTFKIFHFITSDFKIAAIEVAKIYKKRWAVELLFRWMKGHLNIRRLPTKTPNSIKTQLSISVLVLLLIQFYKISKNISGTIWTLLRSIKAYISRYGLISQGLQGFIRVFLATEANLMV